MKAQQQSFIANRNASYPQFHLFKRLAKQHPLLLVRMIDTHANQQAKSSPYYQQFKHSLHLPKYILQLLTIPPLAIYAATFLFHRRRSFAITYPGFLRSLAFKYIPAYIIYDKYISLWVLERGVEQIDEDFSSMRDEVDRIWKEHGKTYYSGWQRLA